MYKMFPIDVKFEIIKYLMHGNDFLSLMLTNKEWYHVCNNSKQEKHFFLKYLLGNYLDPHHLIFHYPQKVDYTNDYNDLLKLYNEIKSYTHIDCVDRRVTELPRILPNLISLVCARNNISKIPNTLVKLKYLNCVRTSISKIPDTLVNLTTLECFYNNIYEIPDSLINLVRLNCHNNKICRIPESFINLVYLDCSQNNIKEIHTEFLKLEILIFHSNQIYKISSKFDNTVIRCIKFWNNPFTEIDNLPHDMVKYNNKLFLKIM